MLASYEQKILLSAVSCVSLKNVARAVHYGSGGHEERVSEGSLVLVAHAVSGCLGDLQTPLQTDRQYSSDSKLLRFPPQPP